MKKIISYIFIASLALTFILNACAKSEPVDEDEIRREAMEAWIKENVPSAISLGDGIYYEILESAPDNSFAIKAGGAVTLNYTIKTLEGRVAYTRSENIARRQGTFTLFTHYNPLFASIAPTENESSNLMKGIHRALLKMKVGDIWRLYLPSKYGVEGTSVSNSVGYGGETSINTYTPVIVDSMEVVSFSTDPRGDERANYGVKVTDFFTSGEVLTMINDYYYMEVFKRKPVTDTVRIRKDTIVQIYYVSRVMPDGFIYDTNIDSVQQRIFGRSYENDVFPYEYIHNSVDTASVTDMMLKTLYEVMPRLYYGDNVRIACVSQYAYGSDGRVGSQASNTSGQYTRPIITEIQPYTSVVMDIMVMESDYDYTEN